MKISHFFYEDPRSEGRSLNGSFFIRDFKDGRLDEQGKTAVDNELQSLEAIF